ncbi:hypothetical protein [Arthrobacter psychrolactophilus]
MDERLSWGEVSAVEHFLNSGMAHRDLLEAAAVEAVGAGIAHVEDQPVRHAMFLDEDGARDGGPGAGIRLLPDAGVGARQGVLQIQGLRDAQTGLQRGLVRQGLNALKAGNLARHVAAHAVGDNK